MIEHIEVLIVTVLVAGIGFVFTMDILAKMILVMVVVTCLITLLFILCIFGATKFVAKLMDNSNEQRTMYPRNTGYPAE